MRRTHAALSRLRRDQSGFTLVELLMATVLGLLVIGVGATVFTVTGRSQPGQVKRGTSIQDSRNVMERITREIRQGSTVYASTASQLSLLTYVHSATCGGASANSSIQCKVTYTCSSGSCTRTVAVPPPGTAAGPAATVVSGLGSSSVFSYGSNCVATSTAGNPGYVCVTLSYPATGGDDAITLQDGAAPINPTA